MKKNIFADIIDFLKIADNNPSSVKKKTIYMLCRPDYHNGTDDKYTFRNASGFNISSIRELWAGGEPSATPGEFATAFVRSETSCWQAHILYMHVKPSIYLCANVNDNNMYFVFFVSVQCNSSRRVDTYNSLK
jgi:hypothetical protein